MNRILFADRKRLKMEYVSEISMYECVSITRCCVSGQLIQTSKYVRNLL